MSTGTFSSQCSTPAVQELVRLNNELRASEGKAPLVCDNDLSAEAQRYSIDLCRCAAPPSCCTGRDYSAAPWTLWCDERGLRV